MVLEIQPQEFDLLYSNAKADYLACISDPENAYLQEEVPLPLRDIVVKEWHVKIVYSAGSPEADQLEVHLGLYAGGKLVGNYVSILDATGEAVDDSLVFH